MVKNFTNKAVLKNKKNPTKSKASEVIQTDTNVLSQQPTTNKPPATQKSSKSSITAVKAKIVCLIKSHTGGIPLDDVALLYEEKYKKPLSPDQYQYNSMLDLISSFDETIDLVKSSNNNIMAVLKGKANAKVKSALNQRNGKIAAEDLMDVKEENPKYQTPQRRRNDKLTAEVFSEVRAKKEKGFRKVYDDFVAVVKLIINSYAGIVTMDALPHEYEMRTNGKLNVKEFGYTSIIHLVNSLGDEFGVKVLDNGQTLIYLVDYPSVKDKLLAMDLQSSILQGVKGKFSKATKTRILNMLTEYYPDGLMEDEIHGAYQGIFGTHLKDFNPPTYGMKSIQEMLENETDVVKLTYRKGTGYYVTPNTYATADDIVFGDKTEELSRKLRENSLPQEVVKVDDQFNLIHMSSIVKVGDVIDVIGGECYAPDQLYILIHAEGYSDALDKLINRMTAFYDSPLKNRYIVPASVLRERYPLAFYYEKDDCYYRGIILNWIDLENVKVFLVDYGTDYSTNKKNAYLLHKDFFQLPAQAIKAELYGLKPPDGKTMFLRRFCEPFRDLSMDRVLSVMIHKIENNLLKVTAYSVQPALKAKGKGKRSDDSVSTCDDVCNINKTLVEKGCAIYDNEEKYWRELSALKKYYSRPLPKLPFKLDDDIDIVTDTDTEAVPIVESKQKSVTASETKAESPDQSIADVQAERNDTSVNGVAERLSVTGKSRYCEIAKKCNSYQTSIANSLDLESECPTPMTPSLSDLSTYMKVSQNLNRLRSPSLSSSSSQHPDINPENVLRLPASEQIAKLLSASAREFVPQCESDPIYTPSTEEESECGSINLTASDRASLHPFTEKTTDSSLPSLSSRLLSSISVPSLRSLPSSQSIPSSLGVSSVHNHTSTARENRVPGKVLIPIKYEVRRILIMTDCNLCVIRDGDEWYTPIDELPYLIKEPPQLQTVLEVLEMPTLRKAELNFETNPGVFMMLARYGAHYLFANDQNIKGNLRMINFSVILPMMEQIYPGRADLLDGLRDAEQQLLELSSTRSQAALAADATGSFGLRDIFSSESMSNRTLGSSSRPTDSPGHPKHAEPRLEAQSTNVANPTIRNGRKLHPFTASPLIECIVPPAFSPCPLLQGPPGFNALRQPHYATTNSGYGYMPSVPTYVPRPIQPMPFSTTFPPVQNYQPRFL